MTQRTTYSALFAFVMMFLAWWGGVDFFQREFAPAYYTFCVLFVTVWLYHAPWWRD